ncbi:MAG: helix-turn-helix domain-containing protein [Deltaproteobacteria bacterium]|nr:helix-turn-helix domain-containing protein [Deltaproteobacteria bacterium]
MPKKQQRYFSTGQAARLCSVTPDTVLKWIKAKKIEAVCTAGGHYRIPRETVAALVPNQFQDTDAPLTKQKLKSRRHFQFCWEHFARQGDLSKDCLKCIVYKSRCMRCWEVSSLSSEHGFSGIYCKTSCDQCTYKNDMRSQPYNIMIITNNKALKSALVEEGESTRFVVRFSSTEYECSGLIDQFRPDYAVIDCAGFKKNRCEEWCESLLGDPRIPEMKIILAKNSRQKFSDKNKRIIKVIANPFNAGDLVQALDYEN